MGTGDTREETGLNPLMDIEEIDVESTSSSPSLPSLPPLPEDGGIIGELEDEAPLVEPDSEEAPLAEPDSPVAGNETPLPDDEGSGEDRAAQGVRQRNIDNQGELVDRREDPQPAPSPPAVLECQDGEDEGEMDDRPRRSR